MDAPVAAGSSSVTGFYTLFRKEWLRFWKVSVQTILAPVLTALLFLLVFAYSLRGHVEVLLAQDCFGWGHRAVEVLLDKLLDGRDPEGGPRLIDPLTRVTAADVPAWTAKWELWLER